MTKRTRNSEKWEKNKLSFLPIEEILLLHSAASIVFNSRNTKFEKDLVLCEKAKFEIEKELLKRIDLLMQPYQ